MAKAETKTSIESLLQALETVQILQQSIVKHDRAIALIVDRLELLEARLDAASGGRAE